MRPWLASLRIQYPGAFYHVMARGNGRANVFRDDGDRSLFLQTLDEACGRAGWRVHAWVLMSNHYHLVLQTPEPTLVVGMQWLQNAYTRRFNTRRRAWGRLFGDRYKAVPALPVLPTTLFRKPPLRWREKAITTRRCWIMCISIPSGRVWLHSPPGNRCAISHGAASLVDTPSQAGAGRNGWWRLTVSPPLAAPTQQQAAAALWNAWKNGGARRPGP